MFKCTVSSVTKLVLLVFLLASTAEAQQIFWKKKDVDIRFNGSSTVSNYNGVFDRVLVTPTAYECGSYQDPEVEVRNGTCYDVTCSGGAGKSPAWDAFYSAKKDAKATKLAQAIKGVGKTSADSLVAGNYFSSKPRSWNEFKNVITSAAANGAITEQVKSLVLSTYRFENMQNLGYSANSCQATPYPCQETVVTREGGYVPRTCVEDVEQVIEQKAVNYNFHVSGAVLLPSETEQITVSVSGDPLQTGVSSSYYNAYGSQVMAQSQNAAEVFLQATGRKQVDLPSNGLQAVSLIPSGSAQATLQVSVAPEILPVTASESLMVQYQVRTCQVGFLGVCGPGWDRVENFVGKLTHPLSTFAVATNLAPGRKGLKMEVQVKVYKQNSLYHNANPLTKTTAKLPLK